ncbi:ABC transporter permease [Oceanobacillus picturae]|uniref:ABC transporter permease n=1 Tax=Oceanobacillus picturae TaxID=171693 RepID=A0A0U9HD84_9BACI|nr:ABC transporter permease [Oceanobacillus picturae]
MIKTFSATRRIALANNRPARIPPTVAKNPIKMFSKNTMRRICLLVAPNMIKRPNSFFRDCRKELIEYKTKKKENT